MDERYFCYVNDTAFIFRAIKAGMRLLYLPEARLLHRVGYWRAEKSLSSRFATKPEIAPFFAEAFWHAARASADPNPDGVLFPQVSDGPEGLELVAAQGNVTFKLLWDVPGVFEAEDSDLCGSLTSFIAIVVNGSAIREVHG